MLKIKFSSILHEGNRDAGDTEGLDEKWTPSIWMESLLASLVMVLESPNLDSPANIDAKKLYERLNMHSIRILNIYPTKKKPFIASCTG